MSDQPSDSAEQPRPLIRVGGPIDSCSATLRVFGDDLDPDTVTAALGTTPTASCRKGDIKRMKVTTRIESRGKWLLGIDHQSAETLDAIINELLDRMTSDLAVWANLTRRFQVDLFCGLQMEEWNRGLGFKPETLKRIAERGLELGLDIYYVGGGQSE